MKSLVRNTLAGVAVTLLSTGAMAATFEGVANGLSNPDQFIGFDEVAVPAGDLVTTQFSGLGVTFTPAVSLFTGGTARPNFSGTYALNFGNVDGSFTVFEPFQIMFNQVVNAVTFASTNNNANSTKLTAFLGATEVESFTIDVARPNFSSPNNIYGFSGVEFDRIEYDILSGPRTAGLDSLAFNVAPIPLPAALPLMLLGLGGMVALRRRKQR